MSELTKAELKHYYMCDPKRIRTLAPIDDGFWEWIADDNAGRRIQLREIYSKDKDPQIFALAQDDSFWKKISDKNVLFLLSLQKEIIDLENQIKEMEREDEQKNTINDDHFLPDK
ncbi:MAG: hypothetical protein K6G90_08035 [Clostridia bacterium]|nr:hypothetical protein [Clostridia bacterium]